MISLDNKIDYAFEEGMRKQEKMSEIIPYIFYSGLSVLVFSEYDLVGLVVFYMFSIALELGLEKILGDKK